MVEQQISNLYTRVRFPSPAQGSEASAVPSKTRGMLF